MGGPWGPVLCSNGEPLGATGTELLRSERKGRILQAVCGEKN